MDNKAQGWHELLASYSSLKVDPGKPGLSSTPVGMVSLLNAVYLVDMPVR